MEALLEKEGDVENWNDERMDELSRRMDAGFEKSATKVELTASKEEMNLRFDTAERLTNRRFDIVEDNFGKMEKQFGRLNDRTDRFGYAMMFFGFSLSAAVITKLAVG